MKKLFLFVTAITAMTFLNSCSSDDNADSNSGGNLGGTISLKIDGVSKTFNNVIVNKNETENYTELLVTATMGNSTTEVISFGVEAGNVGTYATYDFRYANGTNTFSDSGQLNSVVQINSNNKLKGNFSGSMTNHSSSTQENVNFSEGSYDISY